jgi:glycosyltransferase involved in cell wall biosynthesis
VTAEHSRDPGAEQFCRLLARRYEVGSVLRLDVSPDDPPAQGVGTDPADEGRPPAAASVREQLRSAVAFVSAEAPLTAAAAEQIREVVSTAPGTVLRLRGTGSSPDPAALKRHLGALDLWPDFVGTQGLEVSDRDLLAVFAAQGGLSLPPPRTFRVVALITAFNEEDVIADVVRHLYAQGVETILIDNWSTDATVEQAKTLLGRGLIRVERFPPDGPSASFDLSKLVTFEAEIAAVEPASWFIHHDADEIRRSPWPELTLREAFYQADVRGFNAVNHTQLDFHPTDTSDFEPGMRLEGHFRYFTPTPIVSPDYRVNAWKNLGLRVDLASSGGHSAHFPTRRIFPYNFLLKHYPIRSQAHGERKVLRERKPRWNADERRQGWHFQYDHIRSGHRFVRRPEELRLFDEGFYESQLIERLSTIGLHPEPARYSWRSRSLAIAALRKLGLLEASLRVQRRARAALRRDVSSGRP